MDQLQELIGKPHNEDFITGLVIEAAHQVERWGEAHDRAKEPEDWLGFSATSPAKRPRPTARATSKSQAPHISSAAVLLQWHSLLSGHGTGFTPGHSDLERHLEAVLGVPVKEGATP